MHTVALIDDEKYVLSDIRHTFPFKDYGFSLVAALTDPIQALEMLPRLHPDVAFVDIRMPQMSGLDLIRELKAFLPKTVYVVLSGYSEFAYAKNAIRLDVFEYVLKPFDEEDAEELLERLSSHLSMGSERVPAQEEIPSLHSNQQFNRLLAYVAQHAFEPLNLEQIAARFYLNANYCSQLFKNATGKTFSQYVRDRRIERAKELLAKSAMSVSEIAASVGYDDSRYFARIFAGQVGVPPRKYRAECQTERK